MKNYYFFKTKKDYEKMALFYIFENLSNAWLNRISWILLSVTHLIYCDILFWLKQMKKIQLHIVA